MAATPIRRRLAVPGKSPGAVLRIGTPPPPVPAGSDVAHSPDEIRAYAIWLDARVNEFGAALGAASGNVQTMAAATPIAADFLPWAAQWKGEYAQLTQDLNKWSGGALPYIPGIQVLNPLAEGWDRLRLRQAQLLDYGRTMQRAGLTPPELPDLPNPGIFSGGPRGPGGPSDQTIAIFAAGVALLGAYAGWKVAPAADAPVVAVVCAAIGAGVTWYALR